MILINTTFSVASNSDKNFRDWVTNDFITAAEAGGFNSPLFCRILADTDDNTTSTYAVQFRGDSLRDCRRWMEAGPGSERLINLRNSCGENVLWFTTYLEEI